MSGELPRADESNRKGFWQRSATILAVLSTYELVMLIAHPHLVAWLGEPAAILANVVGLNWLAAVGFARASPSVKP